MNKKWQPRPGGWERLNAKISAHEENKRQDVRIWATASAFVFVVGVWVVSSDPMTNDMKDLLHPPPVGTVRMAEASAVEVPGTAPEVHYYWIAR